MQITCLGAARCVTGSCFLLDNGRKYLVDCGLFQGGRQMEALNHGPWGFKPSEISALFITHAHIDHIGRIPKLVKDGFRGKIYSTLPTVELAKILLLDSAHIQEMEAEWHARKNKRRGEPAGEPLYRVPDAEACLPMFESVEKDSLFRVSDDLSIRFRNAGHILGSSFIEIFEGADGSQRKTVFSGDLGYKGHMILEDPDLLTEADTLLIESTYGNRNHRSLQESENELLKAIHYSYSHGEKVIIPAFAVERTQELLFLLGKFFREKQIPPMPVYVDSPLAIAATRIFRERKELYDAETRAVLDQGDDPFDFEGLTLSKTALESMAINERGGPAIVIAGNGMCTAGRVRHHLKHNLWRQGCSVVIVGYQATGSLGRSLVEGVRMVRILGERVVVRAKVFTIGGLSAHADQNSLLEWLGNVKSPQTRVFVIHGEALVSEEFAGIVRQKFGWATGVPAIGDRITETALEKAARVPEAAEARWRLYLQQLLGKAERIRNVLESSGPSLPPHVAQRIEEELQSAERHLDETLASVSSPPQ
ncbi:MAG: MBL fold metallo-hydrolase [Desulfobacteraceae bacterium]|nr:MBL fold metallo-hydrolase [Desulfobacteraceae bacterium]